MLVAIREDMENGVVYREIEQIPTRLQQVFRNGFFSYMRALKKRANQEILHGKKTGKVYRIHGNWTTRRSRKSVRFRKHQSSAPGETHANLTGRLRRSLSWRVHGWEKAEFGYGVSTDKSSKAPFYAGYVEFGTPKGQMKPRPSLMNAIKAEDVDGHFDRAFDEKFGR